MEAEQIKEGNKLIAEFMAIKNADGTFYLNPSGYEKGTLHFTELSLNYLHPKGHKYFDEWYGGWESNWNLLMPVVFKIRKIELEVKKASPVRFAFTADYATMTIESVWESVVRFIKWKNNNIIS